MLWARIAGTAIHLNFEQNRNHSRISYKKHKIWGIKSLIHDFVEDLFQIFYNNLPENEDALEPEQDLMVPIKILCDRYIVNFQTFLGFLQERKAQKVIWDTMDNFQQAIFIVNAFFEAFEKKLVDSYYVALDYLKFITLDLNLEPKLKPKDFQLDDFGFVYRARGYSQIFSKKICNGGYHNTVKRLNETLSKEYQNTFLTKKKESLVSKETRDQTDLETLSEEKRYVIQMLREGNATEKLEAIQLIVENRILEALNELEYHLNNENEEVINAAFDAIVTLKDLS